MTKHRVEWIDRGREPKLAPDPMYPLGIDIDSTQGQEPACKVSLPYPAKRVGMYLVTCETCGMTAGATTAGRVDDPRSIKLACQKPRRTN